MLSLGPINDKGEIWLNGNFVGVSELAQGEKAFTIPTSSVNNGINVIAVRVDDRGGQGGIYGRPEDMFIQVDTRRISLAGDWKYNVETEYNFGDEGLFKGTSIAETFIATYLEKKEERPVALNENTVIINMSVIKNQMKFDSLLSK